MFDRIVVAVDGSECSLRAASYARRLTELQPGINVDLLYVVSADREIDALHNPDSYDEVRTGGVIAPVLDLFDGAAAHVEVVKHAGRPADAIVSHALRVNADLVIIGCRGNSGIKKLTLGSVSDRVVKLASCPVTVVK